MESEKEMEIKRTENEILEIISIQEKEEALVDTHGMGLVEFESMLRLEILEMARSMKMIMPAIGDETEKDKLNILRKQKFAIWFIWDGLNVVRAERGLIVNIYVHTSGKDIIKNRDIWSMLRNAIRRCHSKEGGLVESVELELRSKMQEWRISKEIRKQIRQVIVIEDKEEEFDLIPDYRILRNESETYEVTMTDRRTNLSATGRGNVKYRNQVDWGTKMALSKKVREYEYLHRNDNGQS